jgi:hypothetical protein
MLIALNEIKPKYEYIIGGIPHLTSQFCKVELGSTQILRYYQNLSKIRWATCYQITTISQSDYAQDVRFSTWGCVKSHTLVFHVVREVYSGHY